MAKHKWASAGEWLLDVASGWDADELYSAVQSMAGRLDGDAIQDLFQAEMNDDGYFKRVWEEDDKELTALTRHKVVELLEGISIQCSDDETTPTLLAALAEAMNDGDIDKSDLSD